MLFKVIVMMLLSAIRAKQIEHNPSGIIHYQAHVYHPIAENFYETLKFPPSNKIVAHYTFTFNTTKCCPVVLFLRIWNGWENEASGGYYRGCTKENMQRVSLYSSYYIYGMADFPHSGCHTVGARTVCVGTRTLTAFKPIRWAFAAGYECKDQQNLDLMIDSKVEFTRNFQFICEPLQLPYCKDHFGYNLTVFPNAIDQENQIQANKVLALALRAKPLFTCYQHATALACYGMFPECRNGKRYLPCRQMCRDINLACGRILEVYQEIHCGTLPESLDPEVCFYKPIQCPPPQPPSFGSVSTEGYNLYNVSRYQCDDGYEIQGDAVQHCQTSGNWNSTAPKCEPSRETTDPDISIRTVLIATGVPVIVLIIIAMVCVYYRKHIKILILFNKYQLFGRIEDEEKKLFIAYSSQDRDEVSEGFIPELQEQLKGWTVQTYQDDFVAGRSILDCIKEGVWESQAVLVLLTENFLKSHWCLHEFIEAETRSSMDENFKLLVIIFAHDNQALPTELLEDLPDSLKRYIRTRIYLPLWEQLFWNKLRQALSK